MIQKIKQIVSKLIQLIKDYIDPVEIKNIFIVLGIAIVFILILWGFSCLIGYHK